MALDLAGNATPAGRETRGRRPLAAMLVIALMATLAALVSGPAVAPAHAATADLASGQLTWGLKASWRAYTGGGVVGDGASRNGDGEYVFPLTGGAYDDEARTTTVEFGGSVHWQSHYLPNEFDQTPPAGYDGPLDIYVLDLRLSNPRVTVAADGSTVTAEVVSRDLSTWEMVDHGRIDLADLDITETTPAVTDTPAATTWTRIPATLPSYAATEVFGGQYRAGASLDPVSFTYAGPGGAPDLSEHWDQPGAAKIVRTANTLPWQQTGGSWISWWTDPEHGIIHNRTAAVGSVPARVWAFDTTTMEQVGQPLDAPPANALNPAFVDASEQRAYYRGASGLIDSYLQWNPGSGSYSLGVLPAPVTTTTGVTQLAWDPQRERGFAFRRIVPAGVSTTAYDEHVWMLYTITRDQDGDYTTHETTLPNSPRGWNSTWYPTASAQFAVLDDGSLLLSPRPTTTPRGDDPADIDPPGARRIVLDESYQATVADVPGTDGFVTIPAIVTNRAGDAAIVQAWSSFAPALVQPLRLTGASLTVGDAVSLGEADVTAFGMDPTRDVIWGQAVTSRQLVMIRDGRVAAQRFDEMLNVRAGLVYVDADHDVHMLSSDGSSFSNFEPYKYGYARYAVEGYAPRFTTQPADQAVTLADPTATSAVELHAEAVTPSDEGAVAAPDLQWQVKAPGRSRFADIETGGTGGTLTVQATPELDGAQYRAIAANGAGRLASEVATLVVESAPLIVSPPTDQAVLEGGNATFAVLVTGNPEPRVTWQRRVGGYWQSIEPEDDNFVVGDGSLTVPATNLDQTGSKFRAKVSNVVGAAYSRVATLTVTEPSTATRQIASGSLDWGVKESFRDYVTGGIAHGEIITSGGATLNGDGTYRFPVESGTYDPVAGTVAVDLAGTVRFTGHGGALDMVLTDPELHLDATGAGTLRADMTSKDMETGETASYPGVQLAVLDAAAGLRIGADTITLADVPAELTAAGAPAFAGFYSAGSELDPIDATLGLGEEVTGSPEPVTSTTTVALSRDRLAYGELTTATVRVTAAEGSAPTGTITLTVAGRRLQAGLSAGVAALTLPALEPGHRQVTVTYPGAAGVAGSSASATAVVTKAEPSITIEPARKRIKRAKRAKVTVVLRVPGEADVSPVGQIVVRDGSRILKTLRLQPRHHGKVVIRLPRLSRGKHFLSVSTAETALLSPVSSAYARIRVR